MTEGTSAIEAVFQMYGLAAIWLLMLVKAAGVPIPIPGDLILLATAARAAAGSFDIRVAFLALLVAIVLGGSLQFLAARGPGRGLVYLVAELTGLGSHRLDAAAQRLQRRGRVSIAVALFTPGVRNAALPACGLAEVKLAVFLPALVAAAGVDLALHFAIGAVGGNLVSAVGGGGLQVAAVLLVLAATGLVGWRVLTHGRGGVSAWQATACPACLALGALATHSLTRPGESARVHV